MKLLTLLVCLAAALLGQWQCQCPSCTGTTSLTCATCTCTQPPPPPPPPPPTTIVPAGANLQTYLDAANPGDTLVLPAGAAWYGNYTIRTNAGAAPITVTTDAPLPPAGQRVSPAAQLPAIITPNTQPALATVNHVSGWRFIGVRFAAQGNYPYAIVRLGSNEAVTPEEQPDGITFQHCIITGDSRYGGKRGIEANSRGLTVQDSWIGGMFPGNNSGQDTQAIATWNGPGPFVIVNNYLEASGYSFMSGGARPKIPGLVPTGITFRNNYVSRPLDWKGKWPVKNLFELKNARDVTIEHNVFEHNWVSAQAGAGILFTVNCDSGSAARIENVTFRHNVLSDSEGGINVLGQYKCSDGNYTRLSGVTIENNLLENITSAAGTTSGRAFQVLSNAENVTIRNNTVYTAARQSHVLMLDGVPSPGFTFADNISGPSWYGVSGSGKTEGAASLTYYAPGAVFTGNVLVGRRASLYPPGNHFPATVAEVFTDAPGGNYVPLAPYLGKGADMGIIDRVRTEVPAGRMVQ